ncbi:MAG: aspartate-semialdehyde dehydrogenase, partial [Deltaproteobacteria bacterium]|nr:aspartate-semialdehyde dehydrogenase [Deltaproteobacteria bacterium]
MSTSTAQVGVIVGVIGATGAIGREIVQILEERQFPISRLRLFASEKSLGDLLEYRGKEITVDVFHPSQIEECQFLFFAAGEAISREHAPVAAHRGAMVIDCSSAFREDSRVPLVVPEVNGKALRDVLEARQGKGIIVSSPSSAVIPLVIALNPL